MLIQPKPFYFILCLVGSDLPPIGAGIFNFTLQAPTSASTYQLRHLNSHTYVFFQTLVVVPTTIQRIIPNAHNLTVGHTPFFQDITLSPNDQ